MIFFNKSKNRRNERDLKLDVKQRRQPWFGPKARLLAAGLGAISSLVMLFLLFLQGGEWVLEETVYSNPAFAIEAIDVQTDGVLPREYILKWAGVKKGDNLLKLDLTRIKRDLELVPAIQMAAVERLLPRQLRLWIVEREPVAKTYAYQARNDSTPAIPVVFHIDKEGFVMLPLNNQLAAARFFEPDDDLPTLTGLPASELRPGRQITSSQAQGALRLLREFENSTMPGISDIKSIDLSAAHTLSVTTSQGTEVIFANGDFERQLKRWRAIHELGRKTSKVIAVVDLAVANYVPARWIEASAAPAPKPRTTHPPRFRKKTNKHV